MANLYRCSIVAQSSQSPAASSQSSACQGFCCGLATGGRMLCRERGSATAGLLCVRVDEHEALLHERFLIIERQAGEIDERLRVNEDADIAELEDAVALARLRVELDLVAQ